MAATLKGYGFSDLGQFSLRVVSGGGNEASDAKLHNGGLTLSNPHDVMISSTWDAVFLHSSNGSYSSDKWYGPLSKLTKEKLLDLEDDSINCVYELNKDDLYVQTTKGHRYIINSTSGVVRSSSNNLIIRYWKFTNKNSYYVTCEGELYLTNNELVPIGNTILGNITITKVANGTDHAVFLATSGLLYSFGLGTHGQLGTGELLPLDKPSLIEGLAGIPVKDISSGHWHNLAVSAYGDVYSWGWNQHGQLGHTHQQSIVLVPTLVDGIPSDVLISYVSCGSRHSSCVSDEGRCYMWGWNGYGQIPNSDEKIVKRPIVVKGPVTSVVCSFWSTLVIEPLS